MRATNHKHYGSDDKAVKAAAKTRKAIKPLSFFIAFAVAAAALIVPTTTLAPDVDAYEDSRAASFAVGGIDAFSSVIKTNCADETTVPAAETTAESTEETAQATTEKVTKAESEAKAEETAAESSESETEAEEKTSVKTESSKTESQSTSAAETKSASGSTTSKTEKSSKTSSSKTESKSSSTKQSSSSSSSSSSADTNSYSYYSGATLLSISNPDYSYSPSYVSLSSYDRAKLERLVMGEAGTMGYTGCALVAQAIRDAMNRSGTSSIDRIISEYQYFGSTYIEPNADVKAAVSFIFDQNGSAVQHRVLCFYIGYSSWHETQTFVTQVGGVRFFDLNYA